MWQRLNALRAKREALATWYCIMFVALGCSVASLGPALLELALQTGSTVTETAYIQGIRGFAYLVGSLCGPLYERLPGHVLCSTMLALGGLATALIPVPKSWGGLTAVCILQGFSMCGVDTGGNVLLLKLFDGDKAMGPWMQGLHFCFAAGAFLAPLLLRTVAAATATPTDDTGKLAGKGSYDIAFYTMGAMCIGIAIVLLSFRTPNRKAAPAESEQSKSSNEVDDGSLVNAANNLSVDVQPISIDTPSDTNEVGALPDSSPNTPKPSPSSTAPAVIVPPNVASQQWMIVLIVSTLLCTYVGTETGFGFFATSFAVFALNKSEATGQYLTSCFWGALTLGRFAAIPLSMRYSSEKLLAVNLVASIVSMILLMLTQTLEGAIWIFTACFGFSLACIFPTAVALTESYFPVHGSHATAFVIGSALGEWAFPFIISSTMGASIKEDGTPEVTDPDAPGPQMVLWVCLVAAIATLLAFLLLRARGNRLRQAQLRGEERMDRPSGSDEGAGSALPAS